MAEVGSNYLGFANLPNQVQRKFAKKGFEFTLMVVGESGLGKTTLINCLFQIQMNQNRKIPSTQELIDKTLTIETNSIDIEERGVRLKLTVVDTPGYGDALDCSENYEPILNYIDEQYEKYLNNESGLNRRHIRDTRVHCCFYFISPLNYGLKPADIRLMKLLQNKVNIVPLIAKADFLTHDEMANLKKKLLNEISQNEILIYTLPECDLDEENDYKEHIEQLRKAYPFAVCSSMEFHEGKDGRKVRGRQYPWGIVETENPEHSDYVKLRSMLVSHMQDLREVTHDLHYENFRSQRLKMNNIGSYSNLKSDTLSIASGSIPTGSSFIADDSEKDRLLQEKEDELRKMKELLAEWQKQLKSPAETSVANGQD